MNAYRVEILITPRPGLLDPQGNAIHHALRSLGHANVESARVGKVIDLDMTAASEEDAREQADAMCRKVLANPVTEDYEIQVQEASPVGAGTADGTDGGSDSPSASRSVSSEAGTRGSEEDRR